MMPRNEDIEPPVPQKYLDMTLITEKRLPFWRMEGYLFAAEAELRFTCWRSVSAEKAGRAQTRACMARGIVPGV